MAMTREQKLEHLKVVAKGIPEGGLHMGHWFCGTTACLGGWAASDPIFNAEGLTTIVHQDQVDWEIVAEGSDAVDTYYELISFFELKVCEADHLFMPGNYGSSKPSTAVLLDHIDAVIQGTVSDYDDDDDYGNWERLFDESDES
jgi:hypothetical protein